MRGRRGGNKEVWVCMRNVGVKIYGRSMKNQKRKRDEITGARKGAKR